MPDDIHTNFSVDAPAAPAPEPLPDEEDAPMPPLWKQAVGAVAGSLIALALYTVYEAASPVVTAWVSGGERHAAAPAVQEEPAPAPPRVSTSGRRKRGE